MRWEPNYFQRLPASRDFATEERQLAARKLGQPESIDSPAPNAFPSATVPPTLEGAWAISPTQLDTGKVNADQARRRNSQARSNYQLMGTEDPVMGPPVSKNYAGAELRAAWPVRWDGCSGFVLEGVKKSESKLGSGN
ncbi:hypothetical protein PG984_002496 [Apiospora sp. TS-2023a]